MNKEERNAKLKDLLLKFASLIKSTGNTVITDEELVETAIPHFEPILKIIHEPGPGGLDLLHTINRVTADWQLTMQWVDGKGQSLFFTDMTKEESIELHNHIADAINLIWEVDVHKIENKTK